MWRLALSIVATSLLTAPARADSRFTQTGLTTQPLLGYVEFCKHHPEECRPVQWQRPKPLLQVWDTLRMVNILVNKNLVFTTDQIQHGVEEWWSYPDISRQADCEDYVLLKRWNLIRAGVPASSLFITVVEPSGYQRGMRHAVLMVRTQDGDYVLDDYREQIWLWSRTGYRFVSRHDPTVAAGWREIVSRPVQTSSR